MGRGPGVRAASASSIQVDFRYQGIRCREKLNLPPTPKNLKYASRLKARIEHEIAIGQFDYAKHFPASPKAKKLARERGGVYTVREILGNWLDKAEKELQPETYGDYCETVRNVWLPKYGALPASELTLPVVRAWIATQSVSRKRILNMLTPLRQAARLAVEDEILTVDPLSKLTVRRPDEIRRDLIDPFTPAELAAATEHLEPPLANMATFWAWTGLRLGEIIALTWADVDVDAKVARISKAARGRRLKAPKTRSGVREVRLLPPAIEALQRQRTHSRLIGKEVFLDPETRKRWIGDKPVRNRWRAALAAAGVRYRYPYQLRHTFASWMLSAGESPLWVARQMGHSDWSQIIKTYGRWIPDVDPEAGMRGYRAIMSAENKAR